ncbi:sodium/bile acid cotransporter 5 [Protopterus annectens]|uniref:sodium/bile acid cotransporter 5 n=1 Tax=Protopterus annectens TaxID=7888 RepID=UPI001CFC411D|nr:sodium/bile acid cotransporter 5 [Protopterus annectens]
MYKSLYIISILALFVPIQGIGKTPTNFFINDDKKLIFPVQTQGKFTVCSDHKNAMVTIKHFLTVTSYNPNILYIVNVSGSLTDLNTFQISVKSGEEGETYLKIQLWNKVGDRSILVEEKDRINVIVTNMQQLSVYDQIENSGVNILVLFLLVIILLNKCAFGCKVEQETIQNLRKQPLPLILGASVQFVIMPFYGFILTKVFAMPNALSVGFIMTCSCPGGGGGYLYALLLEGDITLAITMTCFSTLLAVFTMPINSAVYSRILGLSSSLHIPFLKIMGTLLSIAFPISLGILIKQRLPKVAKTLESIIKPFCIVIVTVGIYLGFELGSTFIVSLKTDLVLLGMLVPAFGLCLGYFLASNVFKLPVPICKTVAIESGVQNSFLALAILQLSFSRGEANLSSAAPFVVAVSTGTEMLFLVLFYTVRQQCNKKHGRLTVSPGKM